MPRSLDLHRQALRLESQTVTRRALAQRAIRLEILLHRPRALFIPSAEIRNDAFESAAERIGHASPSRPLEPPLRELELLVVRVLLVVLDGRLALLRRGLGRLRARRPGRTARDRDASSAASRTALPDRCRRSWPASSPLHAPACDRRAPTARSRRRAATASRPARRGADRSRRSRPVPGSRGTRRAAS